jgi:PAS domain S-box-containing protein
MLSLLSLAAMTVFFVLALLVLQNRPRSLLNWSCALVLVALMLWNLEDVFHGNPRLSPSGAELLGNIGSLGWLSVVSLNLLFILVFTGRTRVLRAWPVAPLMIGFPLVLAVAQWTGHLSHSNVHTSFGWVSSWPNSVWSALYYVYNLSFTGFSLYLILKFRSQSKELNERKQATLIFATGLGATAMGSVTDLVLPHVAIGRVPELAGAFMLIWAGGLYFSVTRYGMMRITPRAAADEIIATMRDGLLLLTHEGRVVSANQAAQDLLEYSEAELVGKPASMLFTSPGLYEAALQQVRREGELKYLELTCRTSSGKEVPASISARTMPRRGGAGTGIVWVVHDISGRQEHEAALRRAYSELEGMVRERTAELVTANQALRSSEERFRILFEYAPDAYYLNDMRGRLLDGNRAAEALVGYRREELIGQSFLKHGILSVSQVPRAAALMARNALGQATGPEEFTLNRKDGSQIQVEIMSHPVTLDGKRVSLGTMRDITPRRRAEQVLRESEERLRSLYASMSEGVALHEIVYGADRTPHDYRILDVNPAFERITGIGRAQAIGGLASVIYGTGVAPYLDVYSGVAASGRPVTFETTFAPMAKCFRISVFSPGRGRFATVFEDITDRKRNEEELEAHRHHLEELVTDRTRELTQAQAELVRREKQATLGQIAASMAHELRNPLGAMHNAIIYLNMAERQALSEKGLRHLAVIDGQIERANRIITALLNFAESQPTAPRRVESSEIVENVLTETSVPASVSVVREIPVGLPLLFVDHDQVEIVLRNLVENALLAMPDGGTLTLRVSERKSASAQERQVAPRWVEVAVEDTGCGIAPENLPRLFEPLFSTRTVGVGLGLPIARKLTEANHGSIAVRSEPGQGATFTVTLPAADQPESEAASTSG